MAGGQITNGFTPHVSISYSNGVATFDELNAALDAAAAYTVDTTISTVSLIDLNRDNRRYEWTDVSVINLGQT